MPTQPVPVRRLPVLLKPEQSRVLLRLFHPGNQDRTTGIIDRILRLTEEETSELLREVSADFSRRHQNLGQTLLDRYEQVAGEHPPRPEPSAEKRKLVGAYFLAEYSLESAALFNPSIVPHPDQSGMSAGSLRFILSLRATGEGHISSITFLSGTISEQGEVEVMRASDYLTEARQIPNPAFDKFLFARKLAEVGINEETALRVLGALKDAFTLEDLRTVLGSGIEGCASEASPELETACRGIWMVASSNYQVQFAPEQKLTERILFPATPSQSNGIEDARFVCFHNDNGERTYYATFTAFDGRIVVPELVETTDFLHFQFCTLNGPSARNKGMALFPRKVLGRYAMLSRQDNENIFLMYSDNIHFWHEHSILLSPQFPWELIQIGNCGSPIETDAGWLVLSHGVGPMRKYSIGAFLLDRADPSRVIGRLRKPLLQADAQEREGYVPNVVYTCGALVHNGQLILPYGLADHATGFATVPLNELLAAMQ